MEYRKITVFIGEAAHQGCLSDLTIIQLNQGRTPCVHQPGDYLPDIRSVSSKVVMDFLVLFLRIPDTTGANRSAVAQRNQHRITMLCPRFARDKHTGLRPAS